MLGEATLWAVRARLEIKLVGTNGRRAALPAWTPAGMDSLSAPHLISHYCRTNERAASCLCPLTEDTQGTRLCFRRPSVQRPPRAPLFAG